MRNIKGYVFVANIGYNQQIFGKSVNSFGNYEALSENGITPYKNRKEAISGSSTFKKTHDTTLVQVGTLEMKMAESHDELEYFKDKDSLVVVAMGKGVNEFYGESTRNGLALPGMPLRENRFKTINSEKLSAYEKALYLVREINRQVQCAATVATFNLKFFQ